MVLILPTESARKWRDHELELVEVVADQVFYDLIALFLLLCHRNVGMFLFSCSNTHAVFIF
jgi:hypothetical protein